MSMAQKKAAASAPASSGLAEAAKAWWLFLITGTAWFIISLVVLRFNDRSITTVGVILGIVFIVGAFNEFMMLGADNGGWKVLHGILGVLFVLAGIWAFAQPEEAFWALASVLGFILLMMGIFPGRRSSVSMPSVRGRTSPPRRCAGCRPSPGTGRSSPGCTSSTPTRPTGPPSPSGPATPPGTTERSPTPTA